MKTVDPIYWELFRSSPTKGDIKKAKMLEAAIACIAEDGIENLTFDAIGKRVGVRRSHVAYYFSDKNEIIAFAFQYVIAKAQEIIVKSLKKCTDPSQEMEIYITSIFMWLEKYPHHRAIFSLFSYYGFVNVHLSQAIKQTNEIQTHRIQSILLEMDIESVLETAKLEDLANQIRVYILGSMFEVISQPSRSVRKAICDQTIQTVHEKFLGL